LGLGGLTPICYNPEPRTIRGRGNTPKTRREPGCSPNLPALGGTLALQGEEEVRLGISMVYILVFYLDVVMVYRLAF